MTTLDVTGLDDNDVKGTKGWKKVYKVTLAGMINGVTMTLTLRSEDLDMLEDIVPFDKNAQRKITIEPVNHTLTNYSGNPGAQSNLTQEEQDELDQDEQYRKVREQLAAAKDKDEGE